MSNLPVAVIAEVCLIVAILMVPSIILLVKSIGNKKSFFLYSLIPMIIAIGLLSLFSYSTNQELQLKRKVRDFETECKTQIQNFISDCNYMISEWEKIENDSNYVFEFDSSKLAYNTTHTNFVDYFRSTYQNECVFKERYTNYTDYNDKNSYALEICFHVSPSNVLEYENNGQMVYETEYVRIYNLPSTNSGANYEQSKALITEFESYNDRIIASFPSGIYLTNNMPQYIAILIVLSITIILNIVAIVLCLIGKKKDFKEESETFKNDSNNENDQTQKTSWEDLSDDKIKQVYYNAAIKAHYETQLESADKGEIKLSKQEKALKFYAIQNNEFSLEDLTKDELEYIEEFAKKLYEDVGIEKTKSSKDSVSYEKYKKVERAFLWQDIIMFLSFALMFSGLFFVFNILWVGIPLLLFGIPAFILNKKSGMSRRVYLIAHDSAKNAIKKNSNYKTSPRHFVSMVAIVFLIMSIIFLCLALVFVLISFNEALAVGFFGLCISFGFLAFVYKAYRNKFCPKCGHMGHVAKETEVGRDVKLKKISTKETQLVSSAIYNQDVECIICGLEWHDVRRDN